MSLCTIICIGTLALCKGSGYGTRYRTKNQIACLIRLALSAYRRESRSKYGRDYCVACRKENSGIAKILLQDIALLNEYGYEVLTYKKKYHYYYVVNRHFDSAEIAFLADAVQASKLSATQKQTLTNKLITTMGDFQATELTAAAHFGTMPKRNNRHIIYTIDTLKQAIADNMVVSHSMELLVMF